jgi:hypothetical protein
VYDSQLVQIKEDLSVCSASVNQAFLTTSSNNNNTGLLSSKLPYPLPPLPHNSHQDGVGGPAAAVNSDEDDEGSENEYEEIRDVQRYMNMSNYEGTFSQVLNETLLEQQQLTAQDCMPVGPPKHFKSFSTSTDDILAEVVQVKAKHDRVLDQLNLEVENLLIKSSSEAEIAANESAMMMMGSECEVEEIKCPFSESVSLKGISSSSSKTKHNAFIGDSASLSGTFGRKKKLDRRSMSLFCTPGQCKCHPSGSGGGSCRAPPHPPPGSEVNLRKVLGGGGGLLYHHQDEVDENQHNHLNCVSAKAMQQQQQSNNNNGNNNKKKLGHKTYSLIPNWKIRDHLMRLPFLKHHHGKKEGTFRNKSGQQIRELAGFLRRRTFKSIVNGMTYMRELGLFAFIIRY